MYIAIIPDNRTKNKEANTMSFITEFQKRGYFYQATDLEALKSITDTKKIVAYIGFDCTAKSLHVGNMMQIMILRLLQQHGHKPIVLVGGGTTRIGDPTGKDEMRKMLTDEQIEENIQGIVKSLSKFITFGNGQNDNFSDAILLNNRDWLDGLKYIDFLSEFGRLLSMNKMLSMDAAKTRLDRAQPLTFLEFNYMILQGYDFYHLNKTYDCMLELGGSDQWGNIIMGVDLVHKASGKQVFGLTTPLLTTSSGVKMGKTVGGAVWLNENQLSPYDYFQYWRNIEDADLVRFAWFYAEWSDEQMDEFKTLSESNINEAKKNLAYKLTSMCHGAAAADSALETAQLVFEAGGIGGDVPIYEVTEGALMVGITAYDLFFAAGLSESKSEARKLIRGGGARINDAKIIDENMVVSNAHIVGEGIKLASGKKKFMLVKVMS